MNLQSYQVAVARLLRQEKACALELGSDTWASSHLESLSRSPGFLLTSEIRRSWSIGRAYKGANLTLSTLSPEFRESLLEEWVDRGHATESFFDAEAPAFLDFIVGRLQNPSHELSVAQLERATLLANAGKQANQDLAMPILNPHSVISRSSYGSAVAFYADPHLVLRCLSSGDAFPSVSDIHSWLIFAPGFEDFCRPAGCDELDLWRSLETPQSVSELTCEGLAVALLPSLVTAGFLACEN